MIDLTEEFADLFDFVAGVATVIRLGSTHTPEDADNKPTETDLMWLADSLHNFDMLTRAIRQQKLGHIIEAVHLLRASFASYLDEETHESMQLKQLPSVTFKKYEEYFQIHEVLQIFERIEDKTLRKIDELGASRRTSFEA